MSNESLVYDVGAIRKLLLAAFTAEDLRRFCHDRPAFRPILDSFGPKYSHNDMVEVVITYCETSALLEQLLAEVEKAKLDQYARFAARLRVPATDIDAHPENLYQRLASASAPFSRHIRLREFWALIEERTRRFVGREYVFQAIDDHLQDAAFPSGYIVVIGEPGIGKTSLLAQLVKQKGYVHHFNIAAENIRTPRDFLANVCAQLIVRYGLDHHTLPPAATEDSGFLSQLLVEVAEKRGKRPVVILVDALDEAQDLGLAPGANRLFLPMTVPEGVFFLVTVRPEHDHRLRVEHSREIYLADKDPRNLKDVGDYIGRFVEEHRDQMAARIEDWGVDEDQFVAIITELSEGNFMYLVYVLGDIRDGRLNAANISNMRRLPRGLRGYYQQHWRAMRAPDPNRFDRYYEPVVCILATVAEPVTVAQVAGWTELSPMRVKEVIDEWFEFLDADEAGEGPPLYRIYHTSFQDFLKEEVGLTDYHDMISVSALTKIPGFLNGATG